MAEDLIKFTKYITKEGDTWSNIAQLAYGNPLLFHDLILDNRDIVLNRNLSGGMEIFVRIITDPLTGAILPPWEDGTIGGVDPGDVPVVDIPVEVGPITPLAFISNYPKVVANKIQFAINKSGQYAWSIELVGTGIVESSPLGYFTAGQVATSGTLVQDGFYIVRVGSLVSDQLTLAGLNPITWTNGPLVVEYAGAWAIKHTINKTGSYLTVLKNKVTGAIVATGDIVYSSEVESLYTVASAGSYTFSVGVLSWDFVIQTVVENADWLLKLGWTHSPTTKEFTQYAKATEAVDFRISSPTDPQPFGISNGNTPWTSITYLPQFVDAYMGDFTGKRSFNPAVVGQGTDGIGIGSFYLWIRRSANPAVVVRKLISTDASNHVFPPVDVPLTSVNPDLPSCSLNGGRPPTFFGALGSIAANRITFTFDANGVPRLYVRIKQGDALIRQTELVYYKNATAADEAAANAAVPTPTVQLFTSSTVTFNFATIAAGGYTIEIEGSSCKSDIAVKPFSIADAALSFSTGYPYYTQVGTTYTLNIKVSKAEAFNTRVVRNSDNVEISNGSFNYANDAVKSITGLGTGSYTITVGTISTVTTITPPVVAGDYVPVIITHCQPENMNIVFTGSSENWILNDTADMSLETDAESVYMVAGKVVYRGKGKLTNIPYQSNNPVRVVKGKIRIGISNEVAWDEFNENNYFTQPWNQSCATMLAHFKPVL